MTGVELIAAERERQISVEGWTTEHDDEHVHEEMAKAAAWYAIPYWVRDILTRDPDVAPPGFGLPMGAIWPWDRDWWKPTPEDRVRELVKAGALIAAEIDRLQRTLDAITNEVQRR